MLLLNLIATRFLTSLAVHMSCARVLFTCLVTHHWRTCCIPLPPSQLGRGFSKVTMALDERPQVLLNPLLTTLLEAFLFWSFRGHVSGQQILFVLCRIIKCACARDGLVLVNVGPIVQMSGKSIIKPVSIVRPLLDILASLPKIMQKAQCKSYEESQSDPADDYEGCGGRAVPAAPLAVGDARVGGSEWPFHWIPEHNGRGPAENGCSWRGHLKSALNL